MFPECVFPNVSLNMSMFPYQSCGNNDTFSWWPTKYPKARGRPLTLKLEGDLSKSENLQHQGCSILPVHFLAWTRIPGVQTEGGTMVEQTYGNKLLWNLVTFRGLIRPKYLIEQQLLLINRAYVALTCSPYFTGCFFSSFPPSRLQV